MRHAKNNKLRNLARQAADRAQLRHEAVSDVIPTKKDQQNLIEAIDLLEPFIRKSLAQIRRRDFCSHIHSGC
jgi:hypothetical protein